MKTTKTIIFLSMLFCCIYAQGQVKTNLNNALKFTEKGKFNKAYSKGIDFEIPAKNIDALLEQERNELNSTNEDKPFRLAKAIPVDIDIAQKVKWTEDGMYAYAKFSIKLKGAMSSSINFDKFYLPKDTEMWIYNESGEMITGPVTENENNLNQIWGSWVYQEEYLTVEIKTPLVTKAKLLLHTNNVAYGYKQVYKTEAGGFGLSAPCNINVICPLGVGWEAERNSVALVLNQNGEVWCSGAMIMNTCNTNRPFFLTANHCFTGQNVTAWRFMFQAFSSTCPHPGINSDGVTYNGSTLRANWDGSDFCLVELNSTPPVNSGIHYAGWSRNTNNITSTTIIHHPRGDVMKISRDIQPPVFEGFLGANCWRLGLDQGATEGGSSGGPYFDQNHRIIGQHYGVNDADLPICQRFNKFGGRFDLSWTGDGTNATRLSNWLDPNNLGTMTTNTTNINNLLNVSNPANQIVGANLICSIGSTSNYSIVVPTGLTITWSASGSVSINSNTGIATAIGNGAGTITANVSGGTCGTVTFTKSV
jgi:hypothetical protein